MNFIINRLKSFKHAWNGIKILFKEEPNARIHFIAILFVSLISIILQIDITEWIAIFFSIALVITAEIFNTAIENISDFISPERNEKIKKIKDLSAAAVLVSAITAIIVAFIIFIPKINFQTLN
jgi:diacylglycerol kinase